MAQLTLWHTLKTRGFIRIYGEKKPSHPPYGLCVLLGLNHHPHQNRMMVRWMANQHLNGINGQTSSRCFCPSM